MISFCNEEDGLKQPSADLKKGGEGKAKDESSVTLLFYEKTTETASAPGRF
jgi:hypothetical protein